MYEIEDIWKEYFRTLEPGNRKGLLEACKKSAQPEVYAFMRYISTCKSSGYRKKLFGLMPLSDKERSYHILSDIWNASVGVSEKYNITDSLTLWIEAAKAAYTLSEHATPEYFDTFRPR